MEEHDVHRPEFSEPADGPQLFDHFRGAKREDIGMEYMTPKGRESDDHDLSQRSRTPHHGPRARVLLPVDEKATDERDPDVVLTEPHDISIEPLQPHADDPVHPSQVPRHADAGSHLQRAETAPTIDLGLKLSLCEIEENEARMPKTRRQCKDR